MSHSASGRKKGGVLEAFYGGYQALGGYTGGSDRKASDLGEHTGTGFHSAAKRALIKDFQHILVKLGMEEFKGVEDIDEVLRLMRKKVPDPRKGKGNGLSWGKDKQGQVAVCKTLAAAINDGAMGLIDMNAAPDVLCRQVSEVVYELFGGLSAELLTSRDNLEKALKNLRHLKKFLDDNFKAIEGKISADTDSTLSAETSAARQLHHSLLEEVDRHLGKLQMMIDTVVQPSELELAELERDNEEFAVMIKKINKDFGTREAGRKISYTLTGFVTAVEAARIVEKALGKIGLSIKEYADAKDFKDLKSLLSEHDLEALNKSEVDLDAYERAKQELMKLHYLHEDVAETLSKGKRGGMFNPIADGGMFNPIADGGSEGGMFNPIADGGNVTGGLKLDKRVKRRQDLKVALVKDFNNKLAQYIQIILVSAKHVAGALSDGKTEMSDAVQKFVKALETLDASSSLSQKFTYFAVAGLIDDIKAREERERFISNCRYIISTIDDVLKENKLGQLKDMRDAFQHIIELIDAYVAKFAEGFGPLETWESYAKKIRGAEDGAAEGAGMFGDFFYGKKSDDPAEMAKRDEKKQKWGEVKKGISNAASDIGAKVAQMGTEIVSKGVSKALDGKKSVGAGESFMGGADAASMARVATDLKDAINTISYFNRIAIMRRGLDKASKEFKSYKDDYVKILADAVASQRDKNATSRNAFTKLYEKDGPLNKSFIALVSPAPHPNNVLAAENAPQLPVVTPMLIKPPFNMALDAAVAAASADAKSKANASFDKARGFGLNMFGVVDNMYKVAEAMDIYMKEFTDALAANPDDVQKIIKILDDTEIISKWFDEKSGDFLCRVFDTFPGYYEPTGANYTELNRKANQIKEGNHYYLRIASVLNLGKPSRLIKQGHKDALTTTAVDLTAAVVPADFLGWRGPNDPNPTKQKVADAIGASARRLPGNPYLSTIVQFASDTDSEDNTLNSGTAAMEHIQKSLTQVSSLKNLVASFVNIGERFGGKDLISKTNISPKLLLQYLTDYIAYSSVKLGFDQAKSNVELDGNAYNIKVENIYMPNGTIDPNGQLTLGLDSQGVGIPASAVRRHMSMIMRSNNYYIKQLQQNDMFETSDKLFKLVIKSMVSKILTVIGTFNMFNRPVNNNGLGYYSDLRMILGGAEHPSIIPEAFELYIRLPLLAEFYREVFRFDDPSSPDPTISMVPEMDGTFSELIALIFDKARTVTDGNYSDTETRMLVEIINKIYGRFKNSKSPVRDCIEEFVAEVNRRYGVVKHEERRRYLQERRDRYKTKYTSPEEIVNFAIKGIDEEDTFVRPSPSDQYRTVGADPASGHKAHKHEIKIDEDTKLLNDLRSRIDTVFKRCQNRVQSKNELQALRNISFQHMINARRHELTHATSDKHRYEIVRNAIASLGTFAISSLERSYIMFHETVIAGLNALRLLYTDLNRYEEKVRSIWSDLDRWSTWVAGRNGAPPAVSYPGTGIPPNAQGNDATLFPNLILPAGLDSKIRNEAELRFGLDQNTMFADLFEAIYTHGETLTDLVEVKLDVSRTEDKADANGYAYGQRKMSVHIDYSKLREHIYALFNHVKSMFDKFRGLLPDAVLERYEKYDGDDQGLNGSSLYWIEKKLIDELLEGRYEQESDRNNTLDGTNKKVRELLDYFTRPWDVSGYMVTHNIYTVKQESHMGALRNFKDKTYHQFSREVRDILYNTVAPTVNIPMNDPVAPAPVAVARGRPLGPNVNVRLPANINVPGVPAVAPGPQNISGILKLLYNTSGKAKAGKQPGDQWSGLVAYLDLYPKVQDEWNLNQRNDLVISFNKLLAAYIVQVYDEPSRTIYLPTINKFASGALSSSVMGGQNYDDSQWNETIVFNNGDFKSVLFRRLAVALRQLISERNLAGSEPEFARSDLTQVPTYVKERLRANLPVFRKLFSILAKRADLAKKFAVGLDIEDQMGRSSGGVSDDKDVESVVLNGLDQIVLGCNSIVQCIDESLQDLADAPKYFETGVDFIQNYENMNGVSPFMPASTLLNTLQDNQTWNFGMPVSYLGSEDFKLLYGTRGVLNKNHVDLSDLPSVAKLLKDHNNTVDARHHLNEKDLQDFLNRYVLTVKYLADARLYSQQFATQKLKAAGVFAPRFDVRQAHIARDGWVYQLKSQSSNTNLTEVLRLTESNFQREERNKIVRHVEQGGDPDTLIAGDRKELVACNLIDMNIVPVNLHALMREIPMVNLYNYAYTFDKFIEEIFGDLGSMSRTDPDVLRYDEVKRGDKMLAHLLIDPYAHIDEPSYEFLVSRIFRGSLGVEGLGRPKYLAEEVFNKSLFGEIYDNETATAEPDAAMAHARVEARESHEWEENQFISEIYRTTGIPNPGPIALVPVAPQFKDQLRRLLELELSGLDNASRVKKVAGIVNQINLIMGSPSPRAWDARLAALLVKIWEDKNLYKSVPRGNRGTHDDHSITSDSNLHYPERDSKNKAKIRAVDIDGVKDVLKCWGKLRFDSKLVRDIFWIVNIQRVLRLKLRRDLMWYNSKVVSDHATVASGITELYDHDMPQTPDMFNYRY